MPTQFIVVMAQLNLLVGALDANTHAVIEAAKRAIDEHSADIVVFPELTLTGYPPEDLLLRPSLARRSDEAIAQLCEARLATTLVVGYAEAHDGLLYNSLAVIKDGERVGNYRKQCLPN